MEQLLPQVYAIEGVVLIQPLHEADALFIIKGAWKSQMHAGDRGPLHLPGQCQDNLGKVCQQLFLSLRNLRENSVWGKEAPHPALRPPALISVPPTSRQTTAFCFAVILGHTLYLKIMIRWLFLRYRWISIKKLLLPAG